MHKLPKKSKLNHPYNKKSFPKKPSIRNLSKNPVLISESMEYAMDQIFNAVDRIRNKQ